MKAYILFVIALVLLAAANAADMCSDTDNGPERLNSPDDVTLATKGTVRYGLQDASDTCVTSEMGVSTDSGRWLKEYYCDADEDIRKSRVYDCIKYGFTGCEFGACVGKATGTSNTTQSKPVSLCGNKIKDSGEECDPPGSICFGKDTSEYGQCTDVCTCKLAHAVATKCGNGVIDEGESCEDDSDCESWQMCKTCICVERTVSDSDVSKVSANQTVSAKAKDASNEIDQKYPTPEIHPVDDAEPLNFTEEPAIKTTGAIAKFFMGIWEWFVGLFS